MQVLITCWTRRLDSLEWDEAGCSLEPLSYISSQIRSAPQGEIQIRSDEMTISFMSAEGIAYYRIEATFNACDREGIVQRLTGGYSFLSWS